MSTQVATPWLDIPFVQKVMRQAEKDDTLEVIDIGTESVISKGENYCSDMIRVFVQYSVNRMKKNQTKKKSIIIKAMPQEGFRKEMTLDSGMFNVEMYMMMNTLRKMNSLLAPDRPLSPLGLYTQTEYPTLLVMEDLAVHGFRMANRRVGLDLPHCVIAIRRLAEFHASSVAICEREPSVRDLYTVGMFNKKDLVGTNAFVNQGTRVLAQEIVTWPELDKRIADKIKKNAHRMHEIGYESSRTRDDEFNVINHGDFWVNNMLFRYNDKGEPIDHIFVDFQLMIYSSPALDIHNFFNTSVTLDVYKNHRPQLIREYWKTLVETMKKIECKERPPTFEELEKTMKDRQAYGMLISFMSLPLVITELALDINDIMGETYNNPTYKNPVYREMMCERLKEYDRLGLLDL